MDSSDEYEYRETTVLGTGGEIAAAVVAISKPKRPGPLSPLPEFEGCTRGCPEGECYCGEPMTRDFLFPDGDENGWEGDYE
ncbi:hypothetical protein [Streptomyces sp. NPDC002276]